MINTPDNGGNANGPLGAVERKAFIYYVFIIIII